MRKGKAAGLGTSAMDSFFTTVEQLNQALNGFVWGPVMLLLLMGAGIFLTVRSGFIQLHIRFWLKNTFGRLFEKKDPKNPQAISPFQAVSTALAGTIGVGSIGGVAAAMVAGGPGAIFWMWVSAFFGMATKYAEVVLAIRFRERGEDGSFIGGPMYYIEKGLHCRPLAVAFAVCCVLASFGIGNMTQSNEVATAMRSSFSVPAWLSGLVVAGLVGLVILGGVRRIGKVTEKVVPVMGILYFVVSFIAIGMHWQAVPGAFSQIFEDAFSVRSAMGGVGGYLFTRAMKFGLSRGVFSNEAGLGSAPIAHAAADAKSPVEQGAWGVFEVFVDTFVVCTMTALVVLTSGQLGSGLDGAALTNAAFSQSFGSLGGAFLSVSTVFFAVATILGWSLYGERAMYYLSRGKQGAVLWYRTIFVFFVVVGATIDLTLAWEVADTLNGLMAIPNLIALLALSGVVAKTTRQFFRGEKGRENAACSRK